MKKISDSRVGPKFSSKKLRNPQFKRARLEALLEDEQEKTGKDETEQIGVLFWTNVSMIAKYHSINSRKQMCPCTKKRNVFSGTSG